MKQINHRPQVTSFFDVHLKQVAHVVERRRGLREQALLLDAGGLGVALCDDEPAKSVSVLAGNFLPRRLAVMIAERNLAVLLGAARKMPQR